jgi:hypothetical protein
VSAVDAAVAVADAHGLRCDKPVVLGEAWHVLVHLWPWPVVARVTSGAAGVDPADVERELTVASQAARAGAPVVQPSDLLPPGPHRRDGHTLVFWRYLAAYGPYNEDILEQALPVYASWVAASFMVAVARRPDAAPALERQLRFLRRFRG